MLQNALTELLTCNNARLIYKNHPFTARQLAARAATQMQILIELKHQTHPIAFCMPNSPELLSMQLACFHLGIPIVPIIYDQPPEHIQQVVTLTQPARLYMTSEKQEEIWDASVEIDCQIEIIDDTSKTISEMDGADLQSIQLLPIHAKEHDLAAIMFSSGTSGQLKGIMHTYKSLTGFIDTLNEILAIENGLTYLVAQPMGHIGGITTTLTTLLHDGSAILMNEFDVTHFMELMHQHQPTHINLHTPLFYDLLNFPKINKKDFAKIKCAFAGGDDIPIDLPAKFTKATGAPMRIGYGMTEIGIVTINSDPYDDHAGSVGKIISSAVIQIRDDIGVVVAPDVTGEIWVKSPACCLGYWQMAKLNQSTFVDGWFRTGDLAYIDKDGYYWYMGRATQLIHRLNHCVYPSDIEQVLFTYPGIKSAAVIGIKDAKEGEAPVAFVDFKSAVVDDGAQDKLLQFMAKHLDAWQMPKQVIVLDELPLNLTGKIDRNKLKLMYAVRKFS